MVSNKMIHYEKILASRVHLKGMVDKKGYRGCVDFYRELNNIERIFQDTKNLIEEKFNNNVSAENISMSDIWDQTFNSYIERVGFFGKKMEGLKKDYDIFLENKNTIYDELYMLYGFFLSDKRIFRPTRELCLALNNTKNTTPLIDIKLPYRTIYVSFPPGMFKARCYHSHGCAEGCLGYDMKPIEGAYMFTNELSLHLNSVCSPNIGNHKIGANSISYTFNFKKNDNINAILDQTDVYSNGIGYDALKTLLNVITYISCTNSSIKEMSPPRAGRVSRKKFDRHPERVKSRLPYYIVGDDIRIDNKPSSGGESTGTRGSLTTRFMVRGHYHHFWKIRTEEITDNMVIKTDEDGKVLVRKWLAPYWKGPEYGDVVLKNYKVTI